MKSKNFFNKAKWRDKVKVLSEALPYMKSFNGQTIVIKFGGHAMVTPELADSFAHDIVLLQQVGINPIVVHGGGPQIGLLLEKMGIESKFVDGLRITDAKTIEIVEMVLVGSINKEIVSKINTAGGRAAGICGKDGKLISAKKMALKKNGGKKIDLGQVGEPTVIDPYMIKTF